MRILFVLLCLGMTFAQDLPCAALLGALPATHFNDLTSFEAIFSYQENDETTRVRQVEDVAGQRSYYEFTEGSGETSIVRYDGDTGTVNKNGQTEVAPPIEEVDLLPFFDVFLSQKIFSEAELISCDGVQTLATPEGSVEGEAITLNVMGDLGQFILDGNGHIIAFTSGNDVGVFDSQYENNLLVKSELRIYSLDTQEQVRTMTFELVNYDQEIDETLFGDADTLECASLLEIFKNQPEFTSLESTTTYTDQDSSDYRVVDFTNKRVYWEVNSVGEKWIFRLVNGEVTGTTESGESIEVPEGIRVSLVNTFSVSTSFRELAEKAVVLSCDGEQSYSDTNGEIVRGQQITVADKTNPDSDIAKLLFDSEGNFVGNYVDRPDDDDFLVVNSDIKKDEVSVVVEVTTATYTGEDGAFELLSKITTQTLSYNQPINESLFKP
jgi:hypothetical protein